MNGKPMLAAQQLDVTLSGRTVLRDVSLSLPSAQLVALVGPNGAGKTTLLRALAGLVPSTGGIEVGGDRLSSLSLRERAKRFGYLPQGHLVHWPLPAKDVVALGRYPHGATDPARLSPRDEQAVLRAMQATNVVGFAERPVTELSGGERSRVALARVLAVEAPIVLADEPTASLDPRYQIDVMINLRSAADRGVLVVVVTISASPRALPILCSCCRTAVSSRRASLNKRFRSRSWPTCSASARIAPITATRP
jgi:iron complex transport system ATP-binding protein